MKDLKKRIIKLSSHFTQNEISQAIGVNRTLIFHDKSDLSLKTIQKIIQNTGLLFEELDTENLDYFIKKRVYSDRYKYHVSQSEMYHELLMEKFNF